MKCRILSLLESLNHNQRPVWKTVPGLQNPEGCESSSEEEWSCSYPQAANTGLILSVTLVCISPVQTKGLKAFCIMLVSKRVMPASLVLTVFLSQSPCYTQLWKIVSWDVTLLCLERDWWKKMSSAFWQVIWILWWWRKEEPRMSLYSSTALKWDREQRGKKVDL